LEEEAHEIIRQWEANEPETRKLWQTHERLVRGGPARDYRKLGVHSTSNTRSRTSTSRQGDRRGGAPARRLREGRDRRRGRRLEKYGLPDKVVLRSDGTSLYITQDLYLAKKRVEEHGLDGLTYIVGNEQTSSSSSSSRFSKLLGYPWASKLTHLSYATLTCSAAASSRARAPSPTARRPRLRARD